MLVRLYLIALLALAAASEDTRAGKRHHHHHDALTLFDNHMSQVMSQLSGYTGRVIPHLTSFWPWADLAQAASALGEEEALEDSSSVKDDTDKYEVKLHVRRFKPEEITVKVKNRAMLIEGKRYVTNLKTNKRFLGNHFVQQFTLPAGVESDEVTAVIKPNGVLVVSAPRHPVPPPKPERLVPIIIEEPPEKPIERPEEPSKESDEASKEPDETKAESNPSADDSEDRPSDQKRLKQTLNKDTFEEESKIEGAQDSSSVVGKIRKKELKTNTKKNETKKKSEMNELDYAVDINTE